MTHILFHVLFIIFLRTYHLTSIVYKAVEDKGYAIELL